jgi:DNA-binding CsgD family transcriptional regulator
MRNSGTNTPRALAALGIDEMEERTYRALLGHRLATTEDIANLLSLPLDQAQQVLDSIETKGLATHSPEQPRRYIAAPPELAVEALASQRKADIERARLRIPELKEEIVSPPRTQEHEQFVEIITGRNTLGQVLTQLNQTVQSEVFGFQRAPWLLPHIRQPDVRRGVRIRSISDGEFLELPGAWDRLLIDIQTGEEARAFSTLPFKMFVVDRRIGLISLDAKDLSGPMLLVRSCALLDALCVLFELIWERATPIALARTGKLETGSPASRLTEATEQLISLLASGLNDKAIAYQAKISAATLNRRLAELMKSLGTRTRFQLGWRAALERYPNGWTQEPGANGLPLLSLPTE